MTTPPLSLIGKLKRLRAIVEAGRIVNSSLDLPTTLSILVDVASKNLNATRATIYLVDPDREELWSEAIRAEKSVQIRLPMNTGIAGYVASTGKTVNVRDAYLDKRFYSGIDQQTGTRTKSMLCMPMRDYNGKIVGVFQIMNKRRGVFSAADQAFLSELSIPASIAIQNALLHKAEIERQKMLKELEVAASIQRQLLPRALPAVEGVALAARTVPCRAVGGDFFDIVRVDAHRLLLVVADVSGKGISGSLLVSALKAALYTYVELKISLPDIAAKLNGFLCENAPPGQFITLVLGLYDETSRMLSYVNAGHNYPLMVRKDGSITELDKGGLPLGMFAGKTYEQGEVHLAPEDVLLLYTDGLTEAVNRESSFYGESRLHAVMRKNRQRDVTEIEREIMNDLSTFTGPTPLADDLTLLIMKLLPA